MKDKKFTTNLSKNTSATVQMGRTSRFTMWLGRLTSCWFLLTSNAHVLIVIKNEIVNNRLSQKKALRSYGLSHGDMLDFMAETLEGSAKSLANMKRDEHINTEVDSKEADQFLQNLMKGLDK